MNQTELTHFIKTTLQFFDEVSGKKAECGIPFIKKADPVVLEYTGIIGISGERKGSIYFTTEKSQLLSLAKIMLGAGEFSSAEIKDLVGEIANTISGNLRRIFGIGFLISVPVIVEGKTHDIKLPEDIDSYVIPIKWDNTQSYLVVGLE
jgi:chemotaxis protein CheX